MPNEEQIFNFLEATGYQLGDASYEQYMKLVGVFGSSSIDTAFDYLEMKLGDQSFNKAIEKEKFLATAQIWCQDTPPEQALVLMGDGDEPEHEVAAQKVDVDQVGTVRCSQCKKTGVRFDTFKNGTQKKSCVTCSEKREKRRQTKRGGVDTSKCIKCKRSDVQFSMFKTGGKRKLTCDGCCKANKEKRGAKPLVLQVIGVDMVDD